MEESAYPCRLARLERAPRHNMYVVMCCRSIFATCQINLDGTTQIDPYIHGPIYPVVVPLLSDCGETPEPFT